MSERPAKAIIVPRLFLIYRSRGQSVRSRPNPAIRQTNYKMLRAQVNWNIFKCPPHAGRPPSQTLEWQCGGSPRGICAPNVAVFYLAHVQQLSRAKCFLTTSFLLNFSPTASAHCLACRGCHGQVLFLDRPPKLQPACRSTFPLGYHAVLLNGDRRHFLFAWVRHLATPRHADMTARSLAPAFSAGLLQRDTCN